MRGIAGSTHASQELYETVAVIAALKADVMNHMGGNGAGAGRHLSVKRIFPLLKGESRGILLPRERSRLPG